LVCRSYTQDDNPNQQTEWALMDVYQNGQLVRTMTPQRIFYKASQQASTKPDIDQGFKEDLYLVYEGQNDKGQPVIKAHLNPMVIWIWIGAWVMIIGTGLALVENAPVPVTVRVPRMMEHAAPVAGD
jgi:cytochrome c-type biogenesis protein CcmF